MHDPNDTLGRVTPDPNATSDAARKLEAARSLGQMSGPLEPGELKNDGVLAQTDPKDIPLTPAMQKKLMRMIKASAPKHENFRLCHKKCPLFKIKGCWNRSAAEQQECWEKNISTRTCCKDGGNGCKCLECKELRTCWTNNSGWINIDLPKKEITPEAPAPEAK